MVRNAMLVECQDLVLHESVRGRELEGCAAYRGDIPFLDVRPCDFCNNCAIPDSRDIILQFSKVIISVNIMIEGFVRVRVAQERSFIAFDAQNIQAVIKLLCANSSQTVCVSV